MSQYSPRLNREEELEIFAKMLSRDIPDRILLIHAEGGMGKSYLMREFVAQCQNNNSFVAIDFKNGNISLPELISRICDALGWENFKDLSELLEGVPDQEVAVTGNTLRGKNQIVIEQILNVPDKETRERHQVTITDALFSDLRKLKQVVLLLDTFNDCADPSVAEWISGAFLSRVCNSKNIVSVISGRNIPEQALDWHALCHELVLEGIESKYFEDYAKDEGIRVHPERIRGLCDAFEGRPLPILNQLKAYAFQESQS